MSEKMKRIRKELLAGLIILAAVLLPVWPQEVQAAGTTKVTQVSLGDTHGAVVDKNGNLWMWGSNNLGELGNGTTWSSEKPVKVMTNVKEVSLGDDTSAAIRTDGSLWTWGYNRHGQLGDGTKTNRNKPVKIMTNVKEVSLGDYHSAAVKTDGSLWMWGDNYRGCLGDGTKTDRKRPVKVMTDVKEVSLGTWRSAAVKTDGSLWVWGSGYLGNGTYGSTWPVKVMTDVKEVSLGGFQYAVIKTDGSLWTWGDNGNGQLGDGTKVSRDRPVKIMTGVKEVSLGNSHSAAVRTDGSLWTWGDNSSGCLGDETETDRSKPVKVMTNVKAVSLGAWRSAAVKTDGSLWTWGGSYLGNGSYGRSSKPVKIAINQKQTITINRTIVKTYVQGGTFSLGARAEGKLTYQSSNAKVAVVSAAGVVKMTGCGTAVITVKAAATAEYEAAAATVQLTVKKGKQTITVNKTITVKNYGKGETFNLGARAAGKLTYKISNPKVAVISASGVVKMTGVGKAVITVNAAATAEYEAATETVQLTVEPGIQLISVTSEKKGYLSFRWERNSLVNGYEINYSPNKLFNPLQRGTTKNNLITDGSVGGLVSGQIYFVRVRGFNLVNGIKVYGPWSAVKSYKVK